MFLLSQIHPFGGKRRKFFKTDLFFFPMAKNTLERPVDSPFRILNWQMLFQRCSHALLLNLVAEITKTTNAFQGQLTPLWTLKNVVMKHQFDMPQFGNQWSSQNSYFQIRQISPPASHSLSLTTAHKYSRSSLFFLTQFKDCANDGENVWCLFRWDDLKSRLLLLWWTRRNIPTMGSLLLASWSVTACV